VGFGLRRNAWRFVAFGRILESQTLWAPDYSEAGASVARASVNLAACHGWRTGRLEAAPCFGVGLQRVAAEGTGADVNERSSVSWVPVVEAGAAAHLYVFDWAALVVSATVGIGAARPRFVISDVGEVGSLGLVEGSAGLGVEWIF
jgi:hypothetical protein